MEIDKDIFLERVVNFCYLGDMLDGARCSDQAVTSRIGNGWNKFRALAPLMCAKRTLMVDRGKLYSACVIRSCMIYGSETWALTVENQRRLERAEMHILRRMCNVTVATLKGRLSNDMVWKKVEVECNSVRSTEVVMAHTNRIR